MIKYSLIIPIYNVEDYILDCVKSVHNQSFYNFEAIFVDDGSKDNSIKILNDYLKENNDKRIKLLSKKNGGLSDARNYGIKHANGKYLCFIDSDDFISNDYFNKIDKAIGNKDIDILYFDYYKYFSNEEFFRCSGLNKKNEITIRNCLMSPPAAWNKVYKKSLFIENKIEYPKGLWYEDMATTPRLLLNVKNIEYINEPLYYYRQRQGSIMNTVNNKVLDMNNVLNLILNYYKENGKLSTYYSEIENIFIVQSYFMIYSFSKMKDKKRINIQKDISKKLNDLFPNWSKNKYFKEEKFITKLCILTMKYNFLLPFYNMCRR